MQLPDKQNTVILWELNFSMWYFWELNFTICVTLGTELCLLCGRPTYANKTLLYNLKLKLLHWLTIYI